MTKKEFFDEIKNGYYELQTASLESFCEMYKFVAPIFGKLEVEIEKLEDGTSKLTFIDRDIYDFRINSNGEKVEEPVDMSSVSMVLYLDADGIVKTVEHGISIFTPANKDLVLFYGGLIEKRIDIN